MRKRGCSVILRLTEEELSRLDAQVERSGVTRQAYLRHLVSGDMPRPVPPNIFHEVMRELYWVGNNLNQIAAKANKLGVIDTEKYDANVRDLHRMIEKINDAVVNPKPMSETDSGSPPVTETGIEYEADEDRSATFEELFGGDDT